MVVHSVEELAAAAVDSDHVVPSRFVELTAVIFDAQLPPILATESALEMAAEGIGAELDREGSPTLLTTAVVS